MLDSILKVPDLETPLKTQKISKKQFQQKIGFSKIGEKITIGTLKTIENENSQNFTYQHSVIKDNVSKLGVIVSLETNQKND